MFGKNALREEIIDLKKRVEIAERNSAVDKEYVFGVNRRANQISEEKERIQTQLDMATHHITDMANQAKEIEDYLKEAGFNYQGMIDHIEQRKNKKYYG